MKSTFHLTRPDDAPATMTITMGIGEWRQIRKQLSEDYPSWRLGLMISKLLEKADAHFTQIDETKEP
jgi:hypothetical protein